MNEPPTPPNAACDPRPRAFDGALWLLPVLASAALVLLLRAAGFEYVFVDGDVVFPPADPQYHLRRAVEVFEHFPDVLLFDHYINFPGGAPIPWPPLFDVVMGAIPRFAGADEHGFEVFAAWLSPLCALLAGLPIVLVARRVSNEVGPRVPALALLIFAIAPLLVSHGRIGMADHHAAVSMIGAWMLLCCVAQVDPGLSRASAARWTAAHVVVRLALLFTWHGSLLYLGVAEASLALSYVATGRRSVAGHQAVGAALTALLLLPALAAMPTPLGGPFSAIALSHLHVVAMLGVAAALGVALVATRGGRFASPAARLLVLAAAASGWVGLLLVLPAPRDGLALAFEFMTMSDGVGAITGEQLPLFDLGGRASRTPFTLVWSAWAPLIPLVPVGIWLSARREAAAGAARAGAFILLMWTLVFGGLAIVQRRYGNDFGPSAAVGFALGFVWLADALAARVVAPGLRARVATSFATALVLATAWPALAQFHAPRVVSSVAELRNAGQAAPFARSTIAATLATFLREVRSRTPETSGYAGGDPGPEYGVLAHPNLGHAIQYEARRATATDPFWAYIGRENWARTDALMNARSESEAVELALELDGRYVITMRNLPRGSVLDQLHERDGSSKAAGRALGRFHLVSEAPMGLPSLGEILDPGRARRGPPYKLFEIVPGARLAFDCDPSLYARASARLVSPTGRAFDWTSVARADEAGRVGLRVPWWTEPASSAGLPGTRATGPLRVGCGEDTWPVQVSERAVREGLEVDAAKPAAG